MQHEQGTDTKRQECSGRRCGAERGLGGEPARNWPWPEAGKHYDWMDCHLPFEEDLRLNPI